MAQKLLDHFQICAVVQEMRREAVAKAVRRHMIMQRALSDVFVNDVDHTAPRKPRAHVIQKQRRFFRRALGFFCKQRATTAGRQIAREDLLRFSAQRHDALLVALADDAHMRS